MGIVKGLSVFCFMLSAWNSRKNKQAALMYLASSFFVIGTMEVIG